MKKVIILVLIALIFIVAILLVTAYPKFKGDMKQARERLTGGSELVQTDAGPIEYATYGNGPPALIVHGAGGGYDQGLMLAKIYGDDFYWICPSRFGYLRTPLPDDASAQAQADVLAALLDHLNISRIIVVGVSAGGLPALQFALRHPDRCLALVMQSAMSKLNPSPPKTKDFLYSAIFRYDSIYWGMTRIFRKTLTSMLGVNSSVMDEFTPEEKQWILDFLDSMHPMSMRHEGIANDQKNAISQEQYPLKDIKAPTLVIHAVDDNLVSFEEHGKYTAQNIPGAYMIKLETGGHFLIGQHERARDEVEEFLKTSVSLQAQ